MKKLWQGKIHYKPWAVVEFPWGNAVRYDPTGEWTTLFIAQPDGGMIEVDVTGMGVKLHGDGIEIPNKSGGS